MTPDEATTFDEATNCAKRQRRNESTTDEASDCSDQEISDMWRHERVGPYRLDSPNPFFVSKKHSGTEGDVSPDSWEQNTNDCFEDHPPEIMRPREHAMSSVAPKYTPTKEGYAECDNQEWFDQKFMERIRLHGRVTYQQALKLFPDMTPEQNKLIVNPLNSEKWEMTKFFETLVPKASGDERVSNRTRSKTIRLHGRDTYQQAFKLLPDMTPEQKNSGKYEMTKFFETLVPKAGGDERVSNRTRSKTR